MKHLRGACARSGAVWPAGASWACSDGDNAAPAVTNATVGPATMVVAPAVYSDESLTIAVRGTPCWRELPAVAAVCGDHAAKVAAAFRHSGRDFLARLGGKFAIAIFDRRDASLLLAIDRIGIERIAYGQTADGLYFGTSAEEIARAPGMSAAIRLQSIYDYLFFHMVPSPTTLFQGVAKLAPASYLHYRAGTVTTGAYWRPSFTPWGAARTPALEQELLASLEQGVAASDPDDRTGAFLSGGLDSSSVAGMLARVHPPARTFSIGFGVPEFDELEYARISAKHFGSELTEYVARPQDILESFSQIARAYDEPFGNASALPALSCARLARAHGIDHLLAGDGGDELFGGNSRYAAQQVFERYTEAPQWLRRGLLEPLLRALPDSARRIDLIRRTGNYVEQANTPLPRRLETWNLLHKLGVANVLEPQFLSAIDPLAPLAHMDAVYRACPPAHNIDNMLFYDWHFTLADSDLRKVETMCDLAGVRVSYPMLDNAVIDLSTRIAPDWKLSNGQLRYYYKQATRTFLPAEVINKKKHGFGLPFGLWLRDSEPMRDMFFDALSRLRARRIIRGDLLDKLRQLNDNDEASYYGVLIWVLAMLEVWLEQHEMSL